MFQKKYLSSKQQENRKEAIAQVIVSSINKFQTIDWGE